MQDKITWEMAGARVSEYETVLEQDKYISEKTTALGRTAKLNVGVRKKRGIQGKGKLNRKNGRSSILPSQEG